MVDFDKFEKNVKEKYGNQEFPFDEQNWEKAAKLIDASRKGKNRGGIFLLSAVALLCTSGLVYYFGFSDSTKALQKNNLASNTVVANTNSIENNNSLVNEENVSIPSTEEINKSAASEKSNSSNETVSSGNTSKHNSSTLTSETNANSKGHPAKSPENPVVNIAKENSNKPSNTETKAEEKTSNSSLTNPESKPTENYKSNSVKQQAKTNPKAATPPVLGNNNNNTAQNNTKPSSVLPNTNETGNTNKLGDINNVTEINPTKTPMLTDSTTKVVTAVVKPTESLVVDSVPPMRKSKADSLAAMMPKGEGVSYATNVKEKHNAKNILFAEVGTTYLIGWSGSGKTEAGGFNPLAGINFQHYFSNAISIQIGVQYSTIGNLSNTTHTISTVKYDLGVEQDVTSIKYQKLHYAVAPIKFIFNAGDKNYIGIGCNVGYLLNSESKKEKYKTYSSDPNAVKNNLTSTKETGYVEGFNPFDIQLALSYRRRLYKGLSANAEFIYGLTDTKNNSFFKSNSFDRSVGFKVSLCYDLFKK